MNKFVLRRSDMPALWWWSGRSWTPDFAKAEVFEQIPEGFAGDPHFAKAMPVPYNDAKIMAEIGDLTKLNLIVLIGDLEEGYHFVGPFNNIPEANKFAWDHQGRVIPLARPETFRVE